MFKSGLCCSTATALTQGRGARREAVVHLGEGEAAYCESMPTHRVLMHFPLGHVSRRHHVRRQERCLSTGPGQEDDKEEEQQQLSSQIKFIAPLSAQRKAIGQ